MKRIEDLKENECIEIRNKKDVRRINKLIYNEIMVENWYWKTNFKKVFLFYPVSGEIKETHMVKRFDVIYKTRTFLLKKKSLKKRVKELEKRINELEKISIHVDFNAYFAELKSRYFIKQNPH